MNVRALPTSLLVFVLCFGLIESSITHTSGSRKTLLQYGSAESSQTFVFEINDNEKLMQTTLNTSDKHIITSHQIRTENITENKFNISTTLFFDSLPGEANYSVSVITQTLKGESKMYTIEQAHSVYGMVFFDNPGGKMRIISGDFGVGYNLSTFSNLDANPFRVRSIVHVPEELDLEPSVQVEGEKKKSEILDEEDVILDEEGLLMMPHPYRTGSAMVIVKSENLRINGESFETAIAINIPRTPEPPVVVNQKGVQRVKLNANGTVDVRLDMFNVRNNSKLIMLLNDMELRAVMADSVVNKYEQRILFRGEAHTGKYEVQVRLESLSGQSDVISLYDTWLVISKEGENDKSGPSILGILLIVFGCLTALVLLAVLRMVWVHRQSEGQDREMREKCMCSACEERETDTHIIRDVYGRGHEEV